MTRARLFDGDGGVLAERAVDGLNQPGLSTQDLDRRLGRLTAALDDPSLVVAAVAGPRTLRTAAQEWLGSRFVASRVVVVADHEAAWEAFDEPVDLCVVAGTGSVVVGRSPEGALRRTGGLGFVLGDPGSAARLGQRLVALVVDEPGMVPASDVSAVEDAVGARGADLVAAVHASAHPAALLGRAAPVLTSAAGRGDAWARRILTAEMADLAAMVARHRRRFAEGPVRVVGLAGGVWRSPSAVEAFTEELDRAGERGVRVVRATVDGMDGCRRLARWRA